MFEIVDNIEFVGCKKKLAVVGDMFIKVDEENKILLVNDIVNHAYIDISSRGILREVNSDIATKIETKLKVDLAEYGVEIFDEELSYGEADDAT